MLETEADHRHGLMPIEQAGSLLGDKPGEYLDVIHLLILLVIVAFGATLMLWALIVQCRAEPGGPHPLARLFLVLLRMAIGWHCLVEGLDKLKAPNWSSEGYLRESSGPFAGRFRAMAGEPVVDQLTLGEGNSFPEALEKDWQRYFDAFAAHHELDGGQLEKARMEFDQSKSATLTWMLKPHPAQKPSPIPPPLTVDLTIPERLEEFAKLRAKLVEAEDSLPSRGEKSWKDLKDAKADVAKFRADMKKDLDKQTAAMKAKLEKGLTKEQAAKPLADPLPREMNWSRQLDVGDFCVKYGLVAVGAGLILGLFTRLAAVGGAVLMFMFYLAMPSLPWLPESPKAEGHYLYINKNILEMLALLALACLPTGLWIGLDGVLRFLNPVRWRQAQASANLIVDRRLDPSK